MQLAMHYAPSWAVIGRIGLGFVLPALNLGAMRGLDFCLIAQGASTINFVRQLGGAICVSMLGIVLEWRIAVHESRQALGIANHRSALKEAFFLVAVLCGIAVVTAWYMRANKPLKESYASANAAK